MFNLFVKQILDKSINTKFTTYFMEKKIPWIPIILKIVIANTVYVLINSIVIVPIKHFYIFLINHTVVKLSSYNKTGTFIKKQLIWSLHN